MDHPDPIYLTSTEIIDSAHPKIRNYAMKVVGTSSDTVERAVRLYLAVRDGIRYDPYTPFHRPEDYRASRVLERGRAFCIPKVSLLCALGRACHIPSRVGFATVKNHLATKQLIDFLGSNVFVYHGFVEFYLEGKWVKATPAFNRELCEKHRVEPLEFNGREDSLFHPYNQENRKYMEYVKYHGTYSDIPVENIVAAWNEAYGKERVDGWIRMFTQDEDTQSRDFDNEDVWHE
jgi:transglutaminase-like putative cysteine protease